MPHESFDIAPVTNPMAGAILLLPVGIVAAVTVSVARSELATVVWLLPLLALVAIIMWMSWSRRSVTIGDGMLRVRAGVHSFITPLAAVDADAARTVDLDEHTELRSLVMTFGTSPPGLQMGHFLLRDRGRAFLLLTARRKVLLLPTRDGRRLLLSLEHPQRLLEALSDAAAAR